MGEPSWGLCAFKTTRRKQLTSGDRTSSCLNGAETWVTRSLGTRHMQLPGSWRRLHLDGGSWTGWSAGRAYETGIPHAQTSPGGSRGQTWAPPTFILPSENHRRQRLPTVVLIYSRRAGHSRTPSQEVGMISSGEGPCLWRKRILCPHVSHSPCTPLWCLSLASTSRKGSHLSSP